MKKVNTRQTLIDFFNKEKRAPSAVINKKEKALCNIMYKCIKKGDEEIIALVEKYKDNSKKHGDESFKKSQNKRFQKSAKERVARIRKQYEETGKWPKGKSADGEWISKNRTKSEDVKRLWEDIYGHKAGEKKEIQKPVEETPAGIEAKKVSELTMSEISEFLELIGDKTVAELTKKQEEPMKVDVSKIETILSEDDIRTIINPDNNEVTVTNPKWERCKEIIEYIYADEDFKSHLASGMLKDSTFIKEVAIFMRDNPRKTYANKDKIVERIYKYLPASEKFFKNPANIRDLVTNCF
jgi:hypothetical protein